MVGVFACPECGSEVEVSGYAPGRQVRCACCATLVEVPFLRRTTRRRRRRPGSPWVVLATAAGVVLSLILGVAVARKWLLAREHASTLAQVEALVASSRAAEREGRLDRAFLDADAALGLSRRSAVAPAEDLQGRRDALARRDAEARLAALDGLGSAEALREAQALARRAEGDPALADLADRIAEGVGQVRARIVEADLGVARAEIEAGRYRPGMDACARVLAASDGAPEAVGGVAREEALELAGRVAARAGLNMAKVHGRFVLGSPETYEKSLLPGVTDALLARGYFLTPNSAALRRVWEAKAPYRFDVEVSESQDVRYLQSVNRTTRIYAQLTLTRGERPVWQANASGRPRVPPRNMTAYEAGHVATAQKRSVESERRLFDDAMAAFVEQVGGKLRGMTPAEP